MVCVLPEGFYPQTWPPRERPLPGAPRRLWYPFPCHEHARRRCDGGAGMKLGTSLRFLYPTGPQTYERFKEVLASLPPGGFVERPMGAFDTAEQSRNVLERATTTLAWSSGVRPRGSRRPPDVMCHARTPPLQELPRSRCHSAAAGRRGHTLALLLAENEYVYQYALLSPRLVT